VMTSPNPNGMSASFAGVSCSTPTNCNAVGASGARGSSYTLTERYA
jgi:hypothetical protein